MIEGVRFLPWYQEALRSRPEAVRHFTDCDRCKMKNDVDIRSRMGCGFLPPSPHAQPWVPEGYDRGALVDKDDPRGPRVRDPSTCVGYLVTMREVVEASRARLHWDKGTLREWCGDEAPTPALMTALEELECESNALQAHRMEVGAKKGARS